MIVTVEHVRKAKELHGGYCTKGMRVWCERHGFDFRTFLREGMPVERLEPLNDAFAQRVIAVARGELQ